MNKVSQSFLLGLLTGLIIAALLYLILFRLRPVPLPPAPIPEITQPQVPTPLPSDEDISTQSLKKVPGAGLNFTAPAQDQGI